MVWYYDDYPCWMHATVHFILFLFASLVVFDVVKGGEGMYGKETYIMLGEDVYGKETLVTM